jgi:hypothetical protein
MGLALVSVLENQLSHGVSETGDGIKHASRSNGYE